MALISAHLNAGVIVVVTLSVAVCSFPFPHYLFGNNLELTKEYNKYTNCLH